VRIRLLLTLLERERKGSVPGQKTAS
jgi:hypothetical protein